MLFPRLNLRLLAWPLLGLAVAGCRPQDQIANYTVPKQHLIDATLTEATVEQPRQQMLGAIVLVDEAGWFFKLTENQDSVALLEEPFSEFVTSLKFPPPQAQPQWQLPEGWKALPGDQNRFATIQIPGSSKPLELTVTVLRRDVEDETYVLRNVNRWRGQLGLADLTADELKENPDALTMEVDGHQATQVKIVGQGSASMGGPFASGAAPFASGGLPPVGSTSEGTGGESSGLDFKRPDGWSEAPPKAFSLATFVAGEDDQQVTISVTSAGGDLLTNVNRWRGQVALPSLTEDQLTKDVAQIETLGVSGSYVQLVGPSATILGVVAKVGDSQYFIKLMGDPDVAQAQRANFESFVKSLQLK